MTDVLDFLFGLTLRLGEFGWLWLLALPVYLFIVLLVWSLCKIASDADDALDQTQRRGGEEVAITSASSHNGHPTSSTGSRARAPLSVFDWREDG